MSGDEGIAGRDRAEIAERVRAVIAAELSEDEAEEIARSVARAIGEYVEDEELVKYVPSPGDVTEIGIRLGGIFQHLEREGVRARFAVSTVSTMLMYADVRRVYRFLHVYSGHVERLDWLGVGVLDSSNRDTFDRLAPLYDGMVQTRRSDDGTELRVVGLGRGRTEWVDY